MQNRSWALTLCVFHSNSISIYNRENTANEVLSACSKAEFVSFALTLITIWNDEWQQHRSGKRQTSFESFCNEFQVKGMEREIFLLALPIFFVYEIFFILILLYIRYKNFMLMLLQMALNTYVCTCMSAVFFHDFSLRCLNNNSENIFLILTWDTQNLSRRARLH